MKYFNFKCIFLFIVGFTLFQLIFSENRIDTGAITTLVTAIVLFGIFLILVTLLFIILIVFKEDLINLYNNLDETNKNLIIIMLLTLIALAITKFTFLQWLFIIESIYVVFNYSYYIEKNINNS